MCSSFQSLQCPSNFILGHIYTVSIPDIQGYHLPIVKNKHAVLQ